MKTINDVRKTYLNFFNGKGHTVVPSSSLVPHNDPTLMFSNAGMNQFKDVFTGKETPPYTRAVSSQKCVRAGGKHNDLENVGYTLRHHTFFEMLGNFSFGDYFKEDAISFAWELLTKDFGLPKEKLLATVYHTDDEAFDLWKKIANLPDERIIRIPTDDNFWTMGDTGPCGPCSEVFYDHGPDVPGGPPGSPDEDGDRFIEIWNLVFMQYDQQADGSRVDLPKPCIDTGMGLERMATLLTTGTNDNYKTDIFQNLIGEIAEFTGTPHDSGEERFSQRVIADHLRTCSFLMADGVLPSNEGRGYVLRRIMRRAMRHAHILGAKEPLMHRLVPTLENAMAEAYPQLTQARALITETLKNEETRFKELLANGLKLLDAETASFNEGDTLSGTVAFKLYDTYGFPLDLTQDVLKNRKISVNEDEFTAAMEEQRAKARAAWSGSGDSANEKVWFDAKDKAGATDFLGYDSLQSLAVLKALVMDSALVGKASKGQDVAFITNQTPFYGESGGQVGDTGTATTSSGAVLKIHDTKKMFGDLIVHLAKVQEGTLTEGDEVTLIVDEVRRAAIRGHHSATHLLHEAMRQRLGDHIAQKGSLVAPDRLRFDVSQPTAPSKEDLQVIENAVNAQIQANTPVETRVLAIDEAMESGARALFGEKYDDEVRVVSMGLPDAQNKRPFAVELCGGTHVKSTGEIGLFKIVSEGSVSSGVRRIEALTGQAALDYMRELENTLQESANALKASPDELPTRIAALLAERKAQEKEIARLRKELATGGSAPSDDVQMVNGIKFIGKVLEGIPPKDLKPMADELKNKVGSGVVVLIATNEGKASIVVGVTEDLTGSHSAVDLVKKGSEALGGQGGGGRPDMAQAGGPDATKASEAIRVIQQEV